MQKIALVIFSILVSFFSLTVEARSNYYGGGKHTDSHGGKYSGGSGSSHKGGSYRNSGTGNSYGKHK